MSFAFLIGIVVVCFDIGCWISVVMVLYVLLICCVIVTFAYWFTCCL